jgi:hypothetical protein
MRLRACSFGLARGAVEWRRETSGANFNCCLPLPAPVLLLLLLLLLLLALAL